MWGFSSVIKNSWAHRVVTLLAEVIRLWEHWTLLWRAKTICHPQKEKKKYICLEEQNLESILALPRLSGKAPRWGQSQHFERLCKAQILYPAPDPGDTTALRTEQGKEKQIYQDVSQWQMQRTPEGMADTFCSSGPLENWKYLLGASQRRWGTRFYLDIIRSKLEWLWADFTIKVRLISVS